MSLKTSYIILCLVFCSNLTYSQDNPNRWTNTSDGIQYTYESNHPVLIDDNIEMSGQLISAIVDYNVDSSGIVEINRDVIFPQIHPKLKSTDADWKIYRAYFRNIFSDDDLLPKIYLEDRQIILDSISSIQIDGFLKVHYKTTLGLSVTRVIFPSTDKAAYLEQFTIQNNSGKALTLHTVKNRKSVSALTIDNKIHSINTNSDIVPEINLSSEATTTFYVSISLDDFEISGTEEFQKRLQFIHAMKDVSVLKTPNANINQLYEFSKIRGSESIFQSRYGLVHSPGGGRYYVGFWANDQAEYISPLFPFLGYETGNQSAINCYKAFLDVINDDYTNIQYSFELEGIAPTPTLDRGDAAMIAYGASQFLLAYGQEEEAKRQWPLVAWCLEYNHRMLNKDGVVKSESDEMEGRIETGDANLSTSSLYYGALIQSSYLAKALGKKKLAKTYLKRADVLKKNIDLFFGHTIDGLQTYRYYDGHTNLRHWICMPLVVGINDRKEGTIQGLFDNLWGENGVYVERNHPNPSISKIFWDRGTLYALRGTFLANATDQSLDKLASYTEKRLLKDRVPYAVEAYPEGAMAHLSAESGLYCRIITEGLFGIQATGFDSFKMKPILPSSWDQMELTNNKAFGKNISIYVSREGPNTRVKVLDGQKVVHNKSHPSNGTDFIEIKL